MAIYQLPSEVGVNFTKGFDQFFIYIAGQVPIFMPTVLFSFFMIIFLGGGFLQSRQRGEADWPMWFAVAGNITGGAALLLSIVSGLITLPTLIIALSVSLVGAIWFLLTKDRPY